MKRNFIIGLFGLSAAALLGCPVFSGGGGGTGTCGGGSYYGGSGGYYNCCTTSSQCPIGEYCNGYYCQGFPSYEGGFEGGSGDCSVSGCDPGETCTVIDGGAVCIASPDGGSPEGSTSSDATSDAPAFTGCTSDAACADAGVGALCLDGTCVPPADQCTDAQQCPNGEQCVQGGCVPACSGTSPCPTGYSCDLGKGVCTGNPTPCGDADGGMTCGKGTTCVDQHCVTPCSAGDVACTGGLICVDNGCIPDQKPVFLCNKDGARDACSKGSICLHHACYISCDPEAGATACNTTELPDCKAVTTSSGVHDVCGSSTTLGTDCDPTSTPPKDCSSGKICIDGFCR